MPNSCKEDYEAFQGNPDSPSKNNTIVTLSTIDALCTYVIDSDKELASKLNTTYGEFLDIVYGHHALLQAFLDTKDEATKTSGCIDALKSVIKSEELEANLLTDDKFKFVKNGSEGLEILTKNHLAFDVYMELLANSVSALLKKITADIPDDIKKPFYDKLVADTVFTQGEHAFGNELCTRFGVDPLVVVKGIAGYVESLKIDGLQKKEVTLNFDAPSTPSEKSQSQASASGITANASGSANTPLKFNDTQAILAAAQKQQRQLT